MYLIITDKRLLWDLNYNWPSVHNDWLRFDVLTLISWPARVSLHTRTCDSQALARALQASGLALFPSELRAQFNNPVCAHRQNDGPDIYVWGFPLWQGGGGCSRMQNFATSYLAVSFGLLSSIIFVVSAMLWVCSRETHPFQVWRWPRRDCQQRLEQMLKRTHSEI